jgi:uncharacterized membrane protein
LLSKKAEMVIKTVKTKILFFSFLFLIALGLRLPGIAYHSLWFDEISTANMISQDSYSDLLKAVMTIEGTPPLFFIMEKAFISGFNLPVNEFSLRFLPMLFGVFSCILFFLLFKEIGSTRIAWLGFFLFTFSSYLINQAQEARCYSLLGFMTLLTLYAAVRWWKRGGASNAFLLAVSVLITTQVHFYAFLWLAGLFIAVFISRPKNRRLWHFYLFSGSAAVFSLALLLPLLLGQMQYVVGGRDYLTQKWLVGTVYVPIKVLVGAYLFKINTIAEIKPADLIGIVPVLLILCLAVCTTAKQFIKHTISDDRKMVILTIVFSFILFAGIGWKITTVHPRYMAHFIMLLFGVLLLVVERERKLQMVFFAVILALNGVGIIKYFDYSRAYIEPWRDIGMEVDRFTANAGERELPVIANLAITHTIAYYSRNKDLPIYHIPSVFETIPYARLRLFGHDYYTSLPNYTYYPVVGRLSAIGVMREKKTGIYVNKKPSGHEKIGELDREFKGQVAFTLLRYFKTNQGDVCIYRWNYKR